ncbi:MAG: hypothetical protein ACYS0D_12170 [Planctomycetota bacterium]|jgi:hypothetical protein
MAPSERAETGSGARLGFLNQPQRTLFFFAAFLAACGGVEQVVWGLQPGVPLIGVRFAAALLCCGLLVGRLARRPTLAIAAFDFALVFTAAAGINYARLAVKWHGIYGWGFKTFIGTVLAFGCLFACYRMLQVRPIRRERLAGDWWVTSPLLSLPVAVLGPRRGHHGLALGRRWSLAVGSALLVLGFVATIGLRAPSATVASMVESARGAGTDEVPFADVIAERERLAELLADPRIVEAIEEYGQPAVIEPVVPEPESIVAQPVREPAARAGRVVDVVISTHVPHTELRLDLGDVAAPRWEIDEPPIVVIEPVREPVEPAPVQPAPAPRVSAAAVALTPAVRRVDVDEIRAVLAAASPVGHEETGALVEYINWLSYVGGTVAMLVGFILVAGALGRGTHAGPAPTPVFSAPSRARSRPAG